jgi:hypothetical protein
MLQINHRGLLKTMIRIKITEMFTKEYYRQREAWKESEIRVRNKGSFESLTAEQKRSSGVFG